MARLIISARQRPLSDAGHDNTHFVLQGDHDRAVLVDCGSNPLSKLARHGIGPDDLTDLILTHFHPDHVHGVPILLMQLWLVGRRRPLDVHGLHHSMQRFEAMLDAFMVNTWPNFFEVRVHRLAEQPDAPLLDSRRFPHPRLADQALHPDDRAARGQVLRPGDQLFGRPSRFPTSSPWPATPTCCCTRRRAKALAIPARRRRAKWRRWLARGGWRWCTIRWATLMLRRSLPGRARRSPAR